MDTKANNFLYCFNEYFFLFSCDFVLVFSDFVPTAENRYILGYVYLSLFYTSAGVNLLVLANIFIGDIKQWWKLRAKRKKVQLEKKNNAINMQELGFAQYEERRRRK